jgi:transposase-like protein
MEPRDDLIRAIAQQLFTVREFGRQVPSESAARAIFFRAAFPRARCPTCGQPALARGGGRVRCGGCGLVCSLTARTPFRNTKLRLRLWLAAIWHLHVAPSSISARAFARQFELRTMTAWDLLRRVREAFPRLAPRPQGTLRQTLGRQSSRNRASASVASDHGGITALPDGDGPPGRRPSLPQDRLHAGHLHAWTVATFRGVRRENHWRYLAEWADRQRRRYVGMPA